MSAVPAQTNHTEEEYLAMEREAEYKSEYLDGNVVAMTGASKAHNQITFNLAGQLYQQLKGRPCRAYANDMRVKIKSERVYTYPDITIVCGDAEFEDEEVDTLLNPTVIVEVLSRSTEAYDRGDKFAHYRRLPSLREYLLVAQDKVRVEQYVREGERWTLNEVRRLGDAVELQSVGCAIAINEIYDKVEFGPDTGVSLPRGHRQPAEG